MITFKIRTMFRRLDLCQVCALVSKEKKIATGCPVENDYAACVKKKGQSTCAAAIDDSADTQAFNFFSNYVDS